MKIMVGRFTLEANANIPKKCDLTDGILLTSDACVRSMGLGDLLNDKSAEFIPSINANFGSNGIMKRSTFDYVESVFLESVRAHIHELDGIFLHLHGASEVEGLGSGDHHILKKVREITGPYLPIAIACDPHGNLCQEYVDNATIIRSYRESPHTDMDETVQFVVRKLMEQIEHPTGIHPVYRKLPLILGGEQSVSADEPVRSINSFMNEMEKDERILSASWHVGYIRHDTDVAGCGIVVIPSDQKYQKFAEEKADELAEYVWVRRHDFHYTGLTAEPEEALKMALDCKGRPAFITDSGDNVTSGSTGANTYILRQFMNLEHLDKKVLFAAIHDDRSYALLASLEVGSTASIRLGAEDDELSAAVPMEVTVLQKGRQEGTVMFGETGDCGGAVRVSVNGKPIEIIVTDTNHPFVEPHQTEAVGAAWKDYDIIIVKTGYAFPEVKRLGALAVMSLTDGATLQDTSRLPFKRIMRPMYPIDNI